MDPAHENFVLRPVPPRVVGPGRRERSYRSKITDLEADLVRSYSQRTVLSHRLVVQERELHVAQRIERGCQRRIDRLEERVDRTDEQKARLILTLGSLQKENEHLRAKLLQLELGPPSMPRLSRGPTSEPVLAEVEIPRRPEEPNGNGEGSRPSRRPGRSPAPREAGLWTRLFKR